MEGGGSSGLGKGLKSFPWLNFAPPAAAEAAAAAQVQISIPTTTATDSCRAFDLAECVSNDLEHCCFDTDQVNRSWHA